MRDLKLVRGAWVLVADSEKALFLENHGDPDFPDMRIRRKEEHDNPPTREQAANRPGRQRDAGLGSSKMEDTDWHELEKMRFADDLADMLYQRAQANRFKAIVLVADPSVLGELRHKLHKEVTSRVVGEVKKNFTHYPIDEIERRVQDEFRGDRDAFEDEP